MKQEVPFARDVVFTRDIISRRHDTIDVTSRHAGQSLMETVLDNRIHDTLL